MRLRATHGISLLVCCSVMGVILFAWLRQSSVCDVTTPPPSFITGSLPIASVLDVNIGTSYDPMQRRPGRGLVLVEPLFKICEHLSTSVTLASDPEVVLFCMAISNSTGFATFLEFHTNGVASSLAAIKSPAYKILSRRNVLVMDGRVFFEMLRNGRAQLHVACLKLDMQGFELTLLRHLEPLFADTEHFQFDNILAECMCPGRPLYEHVDNGCDEIDALLTRAGYTVAQDHVRHCNIKPRPPYEWSDVRAWKTPQGEECVWDGKSL